MLRIPHLGEGHISWRESPLYSADPASGWTGAVSCAAAPRAAFGPGRVLLLGVLILTATACGGEQAATADPTVSDSAGITVVENPAAAVRGAERWTVGPEPILDLGVVEGEPAYQFSRVTDAVVLSDGRIAIADAGSGEIRYFDGEGRHLRSVGGRGDGPGEFQWPGALMRLRGDSLLVHDRRNQRLSLLGAQGDLVEERSLAGTVPLDVYGWLPDAHRMAARPRVASAERPRDGRHQRMLQLVAVDRSGSVADTLLTAPGGETYITSQGDRLWVLGLPFGRSTRVAMGEDRLVTGYTERLEYRVRDHSGRLLRIVRTEHEPRAVTEDAVERFIGLRVEGIEGENRRREVRRLYRAAPTPQTMPAFQDLMVDEAGRIWVRSYEPFRDDGSRWDVYSPDGRVRAVAELPARFTPYWIGEERVLGRWRDELDVEHVRVYRLLRGEEGP